MATTTLKRTVTVTSSPFDALTMKVTGMPFCTTPDIELQQVSFQSGLDERVPLSLRRFRFPRNHRKSFGLLFQRQPHEKVFQGVPSSRLSGATRTKSPFHS
jgi:hypothetical protein